MKSIDLGREWSGLNPSSVSSAGDEEKHTEYPALYLILKDGQDVGKLPYEGTMTISYSVKRDNRNVQTGTREIELDVEEILDVKPEDAKTPTAEERFDEVAAEVRGEEPDEEGGEE